MDRRSIQHLPFFGQAPPPETLPYYPKPGGEPIQTLPFITGGNNPLAEALSSMAPQIQQPMPTSQPQGGGMQWEQLLKLLPLILAGMKGGMPAVGGYASGLAQGERQNQMLGMRQDEMAYGREQDQMQRQRQTAQDERMRRMDEERQADREERRKLLTESRLGEEVASAVGQAPYAEEYVEDAPMPVTVAPEDIAFSQVQRAGKDLGADPGMMRRAAGQIPPMMSQRKRTAAAGVLKGLEGKDPASYANQRFLDGLTVDQVKALAGDLGVGFGLPPSPDAMKPPTNLEQALMRAQTPEERDAILGMMERASGAKRAPTETPPEPLVAIIGPDGNPVMVPRSQAVGKRPANSAAQTNEQATKRQVVIEATSKTLDAVDELLDESGKLKPNVRGAIGGSRMLQGQRVPGTQAYDAQASIDRLRARLVTDLLAELKSQSRTGATGFGQLNLQELKIMQDSAAKLNPGQSEAAFEAELKKIKDRLQMIMREPDAGKRGLGTADPLGIR